MSERGLPQVDYLSARKCAFSISLEERIDTLSFGRNVVLGEFIKEKTKDLENSKKLYNCVKTMYKMIRQEYEEMPVVRKKDLKILKKHWQPVRIKNWMQATAKVMEKDNPHMLIYLGEKAKQMPNKEEKDYLYLMGLTLYSALHRKTEERNNPLQLFYCF